LAACFSKRTEWQALILHLEGAHGVQQSTSNARSAPNSFSRAAGVRVEENLEAAFGSEAGKVTMAHAKTFLAEITAFVVAERQVL